MMNSKLSKQRFWPFHENGFIKTIQSIPHNLYVRVKLTFLYSGLRLILLDPALARSKKKPILMTGSKFLLSEISIDHG